MCLHSLTAVTVLDVIPFALGGSLDLVYLVGSEIEVERSLCESLALTVKRNELSILSFLIVEKELQYVLNSEQES